MPAPAATSPRRRLLDALIEHLAERGLQDLSLRSLAAAVGTSHRMLSYHFGSRSGVLVAVSQEVEARQREALAAFAAQDLPPGEIFARMWAQFADPALWPHERLFFALYVRALEGDPDARPFLDGVVSAWLGPAEELLGRMGLTGPEAAAEARLSVAVSRGLLLDLLATGDRAAVDAAMARFLTRYEPPEA